MSHGGESRPQRRMTSLSDHPSAASGSSRTSKCRGSTSTADLEPPARRRGQVPGADSPSTLHGRAALPEHEGAAHTSEHVVIIRAYWPARELVIRNIKTSPRTRVTILGVAGRLGIAERGNALRIFVPELSVGALPCQHAYTFKITDSELMPE